MENSLFCVSPLPLLSEEDIEEGLKAGPMTDEDLAWIDCIATDPSYIIYDLDNKNIRPGEKSVPCDQSVPMPVPVEIITINEEESPSNIVCEKPSFVDTIANTIDVGGDRKITMISKVERVVGNVPFDGINSHSTSRTFGTIREAIKATENLCINDGKNIVIDIVSAPIARTKPRIISDLKLDKNNRVLIKKPKQSKKVCDDIQQILKKLPKSTEVISFIKRKRIDYAKTHPKDKVGIRNPQTPIFENYANGDMFTDVFHRTHTVSGVGLLCSHLLLLGDSIETQQLGHDIRGIFIARAETLLEAHKSLLTGNDFLEKTIQDFFSTVKIIPYPNFITASHLKMGKSTQIIQDMRLNLHTLQAVLCI
ncbi:hypothetical protein QAD02_012759 [Eretmocerus hayati]|uniref:Uncharacterized protein n=1 Tax=Eretmocerus hayati TaxID=131215 RepID=A0ACC2P0T7_9HYME|nr:hypothetical protein QAD02_012759 [Eretmocerus hayati]